MNAPNGYTIGQNGPNGSCQYTFKKGKWELTATQSPISSGYTCPTPISPGGGMPSGDEGDTVWIHAIG